jgi:hydroxymethylbilane synthase
LRIGTRGSALALAQVDLLRTALGRVAPGLQTDVITLQTLGDRYRDEWLRFSATLPPGVRARKWTFELEQAVRDGTVDVALHSAKDLPAQALHGTKLLPVLERADPRDCFVGLAAGGLATLPGGAAVGAGGPRRRAQLLHRYPHVLARDYAGNVTTRLSAEQMQKKGVIGTVLAGAGVIRLGQMEALAERFEWLPLEHHLPAPNQGILALQLRDDAPEDLFTPLLHASTHIAFLAEQALVAGLGVGCDQAIAALAIVDGDKLWLRAQALSPDGTQRLALDSRGPAQAWRDVAAQLCQDLTAAGVHALLRGDHQT